MIFSIIVNLLLICLLVYHLYFEEVIYIITYAIDIEGKRQIDSCRYIVAARSHIPSNIEFKNYVKSLLIESNNLRIIDIHRL